MMGPEPPAPADRGTAGATGPPGAGPTDRRHRRDRPRPGDSHAGTKTVPVRHPGRWVASAVILVLVAMLVNTLFFSHVDRGGVRRGSVPVGGGREVPLRAARPPGHRRHPGAHGHRHGGGHHPRRGAGRDAAVPQPAAVRVGLGLHLVLPGHPGARAALLLVRRDHLPLPPADLRASRSGPASSRSTPTPWSPRSWPPPSGLSLNEGAYMAEIVRAGIISVDEGQTEAAQSLGMTKAPDPAPHRPAPGHADHHPAHRQRDHLHAQDHLAGVSSSPGPTCSPPPRTSPTPTTRSCRSCWWPASGTCSSPRCSPSGSTTSSATTPGARPGPCPRPRSSGCGTTCSGIRTEPVPALAEAPWVAPHD